MIRETPDGSPLFVTQARFNEQTGELQLELGANPFEKDEWFALFQSQTQLSAYEGLDAHLTAMLQLLLASDVADSIFVVDGGHYSVAHHLSGDRRGACVVITLRVCSSFGKLMAALGFTEPIADQFSDEVAKRTQIGVPAIQAEKATQEVLRMIVIACNGHLS